MKSNFLKISMLMTVCSFPLTAMEQATHNRLNEVERLGKKVMPFDLNQTQHIFTKTEQGGIQQVISKKPIQKSQIKLIREHLKKIASEFKMGNFSDPAKIHGKNMPGLAALQNANQDQINIYYQELANGAKITYSTANSSLIKAIHQWFDAQLSDHARHATSGHAHHMMHNQ